MPEEDDSEQADELARLLYWRRREALDAGMSWDDANTYADSEAKTEDLRHLVALHCPPRLLAKVLL